MEEEKENKWFKLTKKTFRYVPKIAFYGLLIYYVYKVDANQATIMNHEAKLKTQESILKNHERRIDDTHRAFKSVFRQNCFGNWRPNY